MKPKKISTLFLVFANIASPIVAILFDWILCFDGRGNAEAFSWLCTCLSWDKSPEAIVIFLLVFIWRDFIVRSCIVCIIVVTIIFYAWAPVVFRMDCGNAMGYFFVVSLFLWLSSTVAFICDHFLFASGAKAQYSHLWRGSFTSNAKRVLVSICLILMFEIMFGVAAAYLKKYREYKTVNVYHGNVIDTCYYGKVYGCGIDVKLAPPLKNGGAKFCVRAADDDSITAVWELVSDKRPLTKTNILAYIDGEKKNYFLDEPMNDRMYATKGVPKTAKGPCFKLASEKFILKRRMYCVDFLPNHNLKGEGDDHFYVYVGVQRWVLRD